MRVLLFLAAAMLAPPAFAHSDGSAISPADLWHHWSFDPLVVVPLALATGLYCLGVCRAWMHAGAGRIIRAWRAVCFLGGCLAVAIALISPLDPLGETLLLAHMTQHIVLSVAAPPLLVLGLPLLAWTWALPRSWRGIARTPPARLSIAISDRLCRPVTATLIVTLTLWLWHAPALFEAALAIEWIHTLEHASFFLTALLAWRATLDPRASAVAAAGIVLAAFITSGMLGGLMLLAPAPLYDWYGDRAALWRLTALEDQQLAGLAMWIPAGAIYLAAFVVFALRVADGLPPGSGRGPSAGIIRASTSSRSMK